MPTMKSTREYAGRKAARDFLASKAQVQLEVQLRDLSKFPILPPPRRKARDPRNPLWLLIPDPHFPFVDAATWQIVKWAARDLDPTGVVIMGDFLDFSAIDGHGSRPPETPEVQLLAEFEAGQRALDDLDEVTQGAWARYYLRGNHEWRMDRFLVSPGCRGSVRSMFPSVAKGLNLAERGYRYITDKPETLGTDHLFIHGHFYSKHHAARHLEALWCSSVYGHTHVPQQFTHSAPVGVPGRKVAVATGLPTMRDLLRDWHEERRIHTWVNGFGVMEFSKDHGFAHNVYVIDGQAAYGGHAWDASHLFVERMNPSDTRIQP